MNIKIKVWTRISHAHYEEWKLVWTDNPDGIPEAAIKTYNRVFWKMHERGILRPLDELAAYQSGMLAAIASWDRIRHDMLELTTCSPTTYVIASGVMRLRQFYREEVTVAREQHRELGDLCQERKCDIQALTEALSDMGHAAASERRVLAAHCVDETLARCDEETRRALRAYLGNNLHLRKTAAQLKLSPSTFAWRRDNLWCPDFRRHCIWSW